MPTTDRIASLEERGVRTFHRNATVTRLLEQHSDVYVNRHSKRPDIAVSTSTSSVSDATSRTVSTPHTYTATPTTATSGQP
jgi:hypothetical protein